MDRYELLKTRAMAIHYAAKASQTNVEHLGEVLSQKEAEFAEVRANAEVLSSALDVMKVVIDEYSRKNMNEIVKLLNMGLEIIFYDRSYSVSLEISDKRDNKYAELILNEVKDGRKTEVSFQDDTATGGGVMVIVGFILQVYYIMYLGLNQGCIVTGKQIGRAHV